MLVSRIVVGFLVGLVASIVVATNLEINSALVESEVAYALSSLRELSESDIYHSLTLNKVVSASQLEGVFHDNIVLELELSSPYFKSGKSTESFSLIVMTHKEDGTKSIAIDEFPVMNDDSIYEFQIEKIKRKRKQKADILIEMEEDAIASGVD